MNTYSQRKQFTRMGARSIVDAVAEVEAEKQARYEAARARAEADKQLEGTISHDSILKASYARTAGGWARILRVNVKTITVPGPWGGEMRIDIRKVREVR